LSDEELSAIYGGAWADARRWSDIQKDHNLDGLTDPQVHRAGLRAVADKAFQEGSGRKHTPYAKRVLVGESWPCE
jgi:hypothetical protein